MDPNANVRERIALYRYRNRGLDWTPADQDRLEELEASYAGWRAFGGYPANRDLRLELALVKET
jgi:hypothetical protein